MKEESEDPKIRFEANVWIEGEGVRSLTQEEFDKLMKAQKAMQELRSISPSLAALIKAGMA